MDLDKPKSSAIGNVEPVRSDITTQKRLLPHTNLDQSSKRIRTESSNSDESTIGNQRLLSPTSITKTTVSNVGKTRKKSRDKTGDDRQRTMERNTRQPRPLAEGQEKEERKPKKKVAVLIGYCGTGYKGMQLNPPTKTIEGDIFEAFVKAGAISKANSDDPKKSSLVRCARTDKGVHAAGNVISLKLITESPSLIQDINDHLDPQIRVWDVISTTNGFSCYQFCDSRMYEYLLPTYCFLPPHPTSFMSKRLAIVAEEKTDLEGWQSRYNDMPEFWPKVIRQVKLELSGLGFTDEIIQQLLDEKAESLENLNQNAEDASSRYPNPSDAGHNLDSADAEVGQIESDKHVRISVESAFVPSAREDIQSDEEYSLHLASKAPDSSHSISETNQRKHALNKLPRNLSTARKIQKQIIMREKRAFRIPESRLDRLRQAFGLYVGSNRFHNFTIQKSFKDPSCRRLIKSFQVEAPIIINETEWISLKVHGQSFMMHQIRKMVGLVMLVIRYGCPLERIQEVYGPISVPIPKAPALGLLLDRPVFDTYNKKAETLDRAKLEFAPHAELIQQFKQKHIYDKLFLEEQNLNTFHAFLSFLDNFETTEFEYLTSRGMSAVAEDRKQNLNEKSQRKDDMLSAMIDSEDEAEDDNS